MPTSPSSAGFDKVTAPGVIDAAGGVADSNVNIYGVAAFVEALEGYFEAGYAYIDAEDALEGQDYQSATLAYTARYGGWLSNSMRVVASFGQDEFGVDGAGGDEQNGVMLLSENSFITSKPYTLLPYANFFVGFERPVPAADETGILKNTGINFESDALTGFPFLNDTGQNAYGGAIGLQYLFDLQQQLVFELAGDARSRRFLQRVRRGRRQSICGRRPLSDPAQQRLARARRRDLRDQGGCRRRSGCAYRTSLEILTLSSKSVLFAPSSTS